MEENYGKDTVSDLHFNFLSFFICLTLRVMINEPEMRAGNANRICLAANIRLCPFLLCLMRGESASFSSEKEEI